jgi:hypothetical protein
LCSAPGSPISDSRSSGKWQQAWQHISAQLIEIASKNFKKSLLSLLLFPAGLLTIKLVSSTGEQASGILIAAAAPVTLLTALSKSSLGKQVQDSLNEKLPQLQADAEALRQQHAGVYVCAVC